MHEDLLKQAVTAGNTAIAMAAILAKQLREAGTLPPDIIDALLELIDHFERDVIAGDASTQSVLENARVHIAG